MTTEEKTDERAQGIEQKVRSVLRRLGMGRAVVYTLLWRAWAFLSGPMTLILLAHFLTREEQGFYFTFNSVIALQVLFELGLTYVLLQFASHEKAFLQWSDHGTLVGDPVAKSRMASLLRSALRWYGVAAVLMITILLPAGILFFHARETAYSNIVWLGPWCCLVVAAAVSLFISPMYAVLEGCNLVSEVALARLLQGIVSYSVMWTVLFGHFGLWAAPVLSSLSALTGITWLIVKKGRFFTDLMRHSDGEITVSWRREVWPFQWKIAISWLSSWFAYQVYNPILFAFQGAAAAGQMGMSLSVMNGIIGISSAWVQTRVPEMGALVARGQSDGAYAVFRQGLRRSFVVALMLGSFAFALVLYLDRSGIAFAKRMLSPYPFGLLMLSMLMMLVIVAQGCYLRAYKQEPFLWPVVTFSTVNVVALYVLAKFASLEAILLWNLALNAVVDLGFCQIVFARKRREWREIAAGPGPNPWAASRDLNPIGGK